MNLRNKMGNDAKRIEAAKKQVCESTEQVIIKCCHRLFINNYSTIIIINYMRLA